MLVRPTEFLLAQYNLVLDSYTGQGGFADGSYLCKFPREQDYEVRKTKAEYYNMVAPIVDAKVDPVFTEEPQRLYSTNAILDAFIMDCDNNGTPLSEMVHKATTMSTLLGNDFIVVDNFKEGEIPDTEAEVLEARRFPYVYGKSVLDVYEYTVDKFGKLQEITFYYGIYEDVQKTTRDQYLYKRFTSNEIEYYTTDKKINERTPTDGKKTIGLFTNGLGCVPVAYANKEILPYSPYYSMAQLAKGLFNTVSETGNLSTDTNFPLLFLPTTHTGNQSKDGQVIGTKNAIEFDADAKNTPYFDAPKADSMTTQMEYIGLKIDRLVQSADVLGTTAVTTGTTSGSGIAESYRFFGKKQAMLVSSSIADNLDSQVVEIVLRYLNSNTEYVVDYRDSFSPSILEVKEEVEMLGVVADRDISDLVTATVNKEMVKKIGSVVGLDDDVLSELLESITEVQEVIDDDE